MTPIQLDILLMIVTGGPFVAWFLIEDYRITKLTKLTKHCQSPYERHINRMREAILNEYT